MLAEKMQDALNEQIKWELYSAYLYLSMSAHLDGLALKGFANWMRVQAQEELMHAMKFYDFILERGGRVELRAVEGPPTAWESPVEMFEETLKHERVVTGRINDLVRLALELQDHATNIFLEWFVTEQVEEEATADEIRQQLKIIGGGGQGLLMMDREMGQRTFTPSAPEGA